MNSEIQEYNQLNALLYQDILSILGSTGTIIPLGDPNHGKPDEAETDSIGAEQLAFTANGGSGTGWSTFDGHNALADSDTFPYKFKGSLPIISLNGTDEYFSTPDAAYWTNGDGSNDTAFSVGMWAKITDTSTGRTMVSKWDINSSFKEWQISWDTADKITFRLYDESASASVLREQDTATTKQGTWALYTATYDGTGGATAMTGGTLYENGVVVPSTASAPVGTYVAMEDKGASMFIGAQTNVTPSTFLPADIAIPFYCKAELTLDQIKAIYNVSRPFLGV